MSSKLKTLLIATCLGVACGTSTSVLAESIIPASLLQDSSHQDIAESWLKAYFSGAKSAGSISTYERAGIRAALPLKENLNSCFAYETVSQDLISSSEARKYSEIQLPNSLARATHYGSNIVPIDFTRATKRWPSDVLALNVKATCGCDGNITENWMVFEDFLTNRVLGASLVSTKEANHRLQKVGKESCSQGQATKLNARIFREIQKDVYQWLTAKEKAQLMKELFGGSKTEYAYLVWGRYSNWISKSPNIIEGLKVVSAVPASRKNLIQEFTYKAGGLGKLRKYLEGRADEKATLYGIEKTSDITVANSELVNAEDVKIMGMSFSERLNYFMNGMQEYYSRRGGFKGVHPRRVAQQSFAKVFKTHNNLMYNQFNGHVYVSSGDREGKTVMFATDRVPLAECVELITNNYSEYSKWRVNGVPLLSPEIAGKVCNLKRNHLLFYWEG